MYQIFYICNTIIIPFLNDMNDIQSIHCLSKQFLKIMDNYHYHIYPYNKIINNKQLNIISKYKVKSLNLKIKCDIDKLTYVNKIYSNNVKSFNPNNIETLILKYNTKLNVKLPNVKKLVIPHNDKITDFSQFNKIIHLELNGKNIYDEQLKYIFNIKVLKLYEKTNITNQGLKYIHKINVLNLGYNQHITDEGLKHICNIKKFTIINNLITDNGLKYFNQIKVLNLDNKNITNEGLKNLPDTMKIINLGSNNNITNNGLKYLKNVEKIFLPNNDKINILSVRYLKNVKVFVHKKKYKIYLFLTNLLSKLLYLKDNLHLLDYILGLSKLLGLKDNLHLCNKVGC